MLASVTCLTIYSEPLWRVGRALRLHKTKTIANVILPYSIKEDEKSIARFLRVMAKNDTRIRQSYEDKKLGGYINICNVEEEDEDNDKKEEAEFRYDMIYDSIGLLKNYLEIWENKMKRVKEYIDKHNRKPYNDTKDKSENTLAEWLYTQRNNYKNRKDCMKYKEVREKWEEFTESDKYSKYFVSEKEIWKQKFTKLKDYMKKHNKRPSKHDENKEISSLGSWIGTQLVNHKNKQKNMKDKEIYNEWKRFIEKEKYKHHFAENRDEGWDMMLEKLKKFVDKNKKRPVKNSTDKEEVILFTWISNQVTKFREKSFVMKSEEVRDKWKKFINDDKYKKYFLTGEDDWKDNLEKVKNYIESKNKRPSSVDKDKEIKKLGVWVCTQIQNYTLKQKNMENKETRDSWKRFIEDEEYADYFKTNEEIWHDRLKEAKKYIIDNKKRPNTRDNDKKVSIIGAWLVTNKKNYNKNDRIMKEEKIRKEWEDFTNDNKYSKYVN